MRFGYNTNGFAHHRLDDTLAILAEIGYESVAITLDNHCLHPFAGDLATNLRLVRGQLSRLGMSCVVETGARFLLDPRRKHQPTLLSPNADERGQRLDLLERAVVVAEALQAEAVSFWSGTPLALASASGSLATEPDAVLMDRLREGCLRLADHAQEHNVRLAFEPEPGMFIDTMARFAQLHEAVSHPVFGLTLDVGHLHCLGEHPIGDHVRRWQRWLWNVHIEDMRRGAHDHLMFGEGEMDFPPILTAVDETGYAGSVHVEFSRHSHDAVEIARKSLAFLRGQLEVARQRGHGA